MTFGGTRSRRFLNVADFRRQAQRSLPAPVFAFLEGAADDEKTLLRNRRVFDELALLPMSLTDVATIDASTRALGTDLAWPYIVGPTGMSALIHPGGEIALARAAAATGSLYVLSTMASHSIEQVAEASPGPHAFQLYVFRDRAITRDLISRARAAGYKALVLTVDIQVPANRERDKRTGMVIPPRLTASTMIAMASRPRWCLNNILHPMRLANFERTLADPGIPLLEFINRQFDPSVTWADLAWVAREWGGPLAVKGILNPADAVRAAEHGASAIILSNHGGRQLDYAPSPMDVLAETVDQLAGRAEVVVDGGVRRGTDILKAVGLGAAACMGGRVGLYGLSAGGVAGAEAILSMLRSEVERDMALLGTPALGHISKDQVRPANFHS